MQCQFASKLWDTKHAFASLHSELVGCRALYTVIAMPHDVEIGVRSIAEKWRDCKNIVAHVCAICQVSRCGGDVCS